MELKDFSLIHGGFRQFIQQLVVNCLDFLNRAGVENGLGNLRVLLRQSSYLAARRIIFGT